MDREAAQLLAQQLARITVVSLIAAGVLLAVIYVVTGRTRATLILYGAAAWLAAVGVLLPGVPRIVAMLLALVLVGLAIREGLRETRARIATMRAESREREEAFGEYLTAVARKEAVDAANAADADEDA